MRKEPEHEYILETQIEKKPFAELTAQYLEHVSIDKRSTNLGDLTHPLITSMALNPEQAVKNRVANKPDQD